MLNYYCPFFFVILFVCSALVATSQDILVTVDGEIFVGQQLEMTDLHVKFKIEEDSTEVFVFSKSMIKAIRYEDGSQSVINPIVNHGDIALPTSHLIVPAFTRISIHNVDSIRSSSLVLHQELPFAVVEDVYVDSVLVIKAATPVIGLITKLEPPGFFGKPGKLEIKVNRIKMVNGELLPLIEDIYLEGRDKSQEVIVLGAAVFLPILLIKGKEVVIEEKTPMYVQSRSDTPLIVD